MDDELRIKGFKELNKRLMDEFINVIQNPYIGTLGRTSYKAIDKDYRGIEPGMVHQFDNPCSEILLGEPIGLRHILEEDYRNTFNYITAKQNINKLEGGNKMQYNLEDEVVIIKQEYDQFIGMEGIVKVVVEPENGEEPVYGLIINKLKVGHDLGKRCEFGQGWYVKESEIELLNKSKLCRMIEKDEGLLKGLKACDTLIRNDVQYNIRKNGALTFLIRVSDGSKVFVYKDGTTSPLILNCTSEDDMIVTLHLMEAFRILPMHTLDGNNKIVKYIQEYSDRVEAEMFPPVVEKVMETPEAVKLIEEIKELATTPVAESKVYKSEEEIYAELGITKKD